MSPAISFEIEKCYSNMLFCKGCCVLHNLSRGMDGEDDYEEIEIAMEGGLPPVDMENDEFEGNAMGHNFRNYIAVLLYNQ